ncbi:MAG: hypothetical protein LQ337_005209 [Flavoplaca oasis]|nr:MAG: hypothetical protein LQ337_005209 [Flavoplaca oasis]
MSSQQVVTTSNRGPIVGVMTWFVLAATVCAVIARVATKLAISRRCTSDDFLIFAALALSIGQGVSVTLQIGSGLGKPADTLSPSQLDRFDKTGFWNVYGAFNLITEAALVALPLLIVWKIQTKLKKKVVIFLCFASRTMVLVAIVVQVVYHNRAKGRDDRTFEMWPVVLCAQIVQSLSIITACIPCLKPFLESLESGMLRSDDLRRRGMNGVYGYGSHNLNSLSNSRSGGKKEKSQHASNASAGKHYKLPNNISTVVSVNRNEDAERDSDSQKSSARIIKYTRTFSVE